MADIAKDAGIQTDAPALEGVSCLAAHLWREAWRHADKTAGGDSDALHDMRVAIRRLRSLLQNFEGEKAAPVLGAQVRRELREQRAKLGKVGDALGGVRDYDVLDEYLKAYAQEQLKTGLDAASPEYSGLLAFERFLQNERAAAFAPMVKRLNKSRRPQGLQEEFARWALGLPAASAPAVPLREVAHRLLAARLDEMQAHAPALDETHLEAEQHELRKSLRRLRYTFETLGPCFNADVKPHIKSLVQLQDLLGEMQDRSVLHEKAIAAFGIKQSGGGSTPVADYADAIPADVVAFLEFGSERRARLLAQVRKLWKKLQDEQLLENLRSL